VAEQGIRRASREFAGEGAREGAISPAGERGRLLAGAPVDHLFEVARAREAAGIDKLLLHEIGFILSLMNKSSAEAHGSQGATSANRIPVSLAAQFSKRHRDPFRAAFITII
jgi:hypothetical protein